MVKESPFINILTFGLPYVLANQIFNEYQSRLSEANFIIEKSSKYATLNQNIKTVEIILALSIFHKRVVANLDAAVKFYNTVGKHSKAETISIGNYDFTGEEKNKVLALLINYRSLIEKFGITDYMMDYYETKELLKKIIELKKEFEYAEANNKKSSNKKGNSNEKESNNREEEDLPF